MAMEISGGTQRLNTHVYDDEWGILLQDATNTLAAGARDTNADIWVGVPFLLSGIHKVAGSTGDGTSTIIWTVPTGMKLRIVDAWRFLRTIATGGTLDLDISITDGTNDICATADIDGETLNAKVNFATIDDAKHELVAGGTIKSVLVTTGTPSADETLMDIHVLCVWVKA